MTTNDKERDELRSLIRTSFSATQYPGDENLVDGLFPPCMPDSIEIYGFYHRKRWDDLDDEFFFSRAGIHIHSIVFLSVEGFLYYLPAFMMHITSPGQHNATHDLLWSLFRVLDSDTRYDKLVALKSLDTRHAKCFARFLEHISLHEKEYDEEIATEAMIYLDEYWGKFLDA